MAHACRAFAVLVFAVAVARASVTVSWNTRALPHASPRAAAPAVSSAVVASVTGTRVVLRLPDGTTRAYTASPAQARALRSLVGTAIEYRVK